MSSKWILAFIACFNLCACATQQLPQTTPLPSVSDNTPVKTEEESVKEQSRFIEIAERDAQQIGQQIWMNEGSGKPENLVIWNTKESFLSVGIGHFIWYPKRHTESFQETFPALLSFLEQKGIQLPSWLQNTFDPDCPWNTREEFENAKDSQKVVELRNFLRRADVFAEQVRFMIKRLELALPRMLATLPTEAQRQHVSRQFYRVAETPQGVYALVDYVNFKGEGINDRERYQGQGWGLLQVLEKMMGDSINILDEFANAALTVLETRVQNAPDDETMWLAGWKNRLDTYRPRP